MLGFYPIRRVVSIHMIQLLLIKALSFCLADIITKIWIVIMGAQCIIILTVKCRRDIVVIGIKILSPYSLSIHDVQHYNIQ